MDASKLTDAERTKWHEKLMEESKLFWVVQTGTLGSLGVMWGFVHNRVGSSEPPGDVLGVIAFASLFINVLSISYVVASSGFIFEARRHLGLAEEYDGGSTAVILMIGHTVASGYATSVLSCWAIGPFIGPVVCALVAGLSIVSSCRRHGRSFCRILWPL